MLNDNAMTKNAMAEMMANIRALTTKATDKTENQADHRVGRARASEKLRKSEKQIISSF
jgi:hypothetical protein